jgi:lipopolysaccharide/colanic/teichoic acid biosynthesis glycosyltransferase
MLSKILLNKVNKYIDINSENISIIETTNSINIQPLLKKVSLECIVNTEKVNNIRWINKFHEGVNELLDKDGIYLSCGETIIQREKRVKKKVPFGFKSILNLIDFVYKRVLPKLPITKYIYFAFSKGHNRVVSKAEILGRIISCGFEVLEYFEYNNLLYVISKKTKEPAFDMEVSYGPLFKMKRVGFMGQTIGVYKFRTMHPYSEYCQQLVINENKLDNSGKIAKDFRITKWGKVMRKVWIDELPMIINYLKGELKLVGVRPLSYGYFEKYPKDMQNLRITIKPGLIPPYYADMPKNWNEIIASEKRYIEKYKKNPLKTDCIYFIRVFVNILFKKARSA